MSLPLHPSIRPMRVVGPLLTVLACLAAAVADRPVWAADPAPAAPDRAHAASSLHVQLNKLEDVEGGSCRAYLVFDNSGPAVSSLRLDLVVFGKDGVIARRVALEAGPLRTTRETVKLFDLGNQQCGAIGSILINDVLGCHDDAGDHADCLERLTTSSKSEVTLRK